MNVKVALIVCFGMLCSCRVEDSVSFVNKTGSDISVKRIVRGDRTAFSGDHFIPSKREGSSYAISNVSLPIGNDKSMSMTFLVNFYDQKKEEKLACSLKLDDDPGTGCHYHVWLWREHGNRISCVCNPDNSN